MKKLAVILMILALGIVAVFALGAEPAHAAGIAPAGTTSGTYTNDVSTVNTPFSCKPGTQVNLPPGEVFTTVVNNCETRVWMYHNPQRTGKPLCINPDSTAHLQPQADWTTLWVSSNPAQCPKPL